jgi:hypothetical protein
MHLSWVDMTFVTGGSTDSISAYRSRGSPLAKHELDSESGYYLSDTSTGRR